MPNMNATYRNALADYGASLITHIGLVNEFGTEISGGTPAYARLAVTWTTSADGLIRPDAHLTFDVPIGVTVAGWRGYSAVTGGTNYGGKALESTPFAAQGTYELNKDRTAITHI